MSAIEELPFLVIGRFQTEPRPEGFEEKNETRVERWILSINCGPRGPLRFLVGPLLFMIKPITYPIGLAFFIAEERGKDRFVIAVRPLVRIFVGSHIRRMVVDLMKGYTYVAVGLDVSSSNARTRSKWLVQVREELERFSELLPTWRSTVAALLGIPLVTAAPAILARIFGSQDLSGAVIKYTPQVLRSWQIWLPPALYFLSFVSWSYAFKRRLFLGEATAWSDNREREFRNTTYSLEAQLFGELPVSRRKEKPLDLLFASVLYLFFGAFFVWLPFSGIKNGKGETAPFVNLFAGLGLLSWGIGPLIAMARRRGNDR